MKIKSFFREKNLLMRFYLVFCSIYLILIFFDLKELNYFLKPLLVPILIVIVYVSQNFASRFFLLIALFFSWIGDITLLFSDISKIYFIIGLVSFLLAHISYIFLFHIQEKSDIEINIKKFGLGVFALIIYFSILTYFLFPRLGNLKIPVSIYIITISIMFLFALKGFLTWNRQGKIDIFIGAIIFIISDSILSFNEFYIPITHGTLYVMITYLIAQFLIVKGILRLNKNNL